MLGIAGSPRDSTHHKRKYSNIQTERENSEYNISGKIRGSSPVPNDPSKINSFKITLAEKAAMNNLKADSIINQTLKLNTIEIPQGTIGNLTQRTSQDELTSNKTIKQKPLVSIIKNNKPNKESSRLNVVNMTEAEFESKTLPILPRISSKKDL